LLEITFIQGYMNIQDMMYKITKFWKFAEYTGYLILSNSEALKTKNIQNTYINTMCQNFNKNSIIT